jgi:hypothetical protein
MVGRLYNLCSCGGTCLAVEGRWMGQQRNARCAQSADEHDAIRRRPLPASRYVWCCL